MRLEFVLLELWSVNPGAVPFFSCNWTMIEEPAKGWKFLFVARNGSGHEERIEGEVKDAVEKETLQLVMDMGQAAQRLQKAELVVENWKGSFPPKKKH